MRGGFRPNAGRKKGFSGLEAEKTREFICKRLSENIGGIVDCLMEKAKKGDIGAIKELFDRAYGRPSSFAISGTTFSDCDHDSIKVKVVNYAEL